MSDTPLFDVLYGEVPPLQPKRDWPEDANHENGCYSNRCTNCDQMFMGHKRRMWCKVCATTTPPNNASERTAGPRS